MIITRVRPSTFLVGVMMLWAVISVCTAFSRNYTGLLVTRFFLGVVEAPYYPGALCTFSLGGSPKATADDLDCPVILSQFYTRTEIATRIAFLYTGNILATGAEAGFLPMRISLRLDCPSQLLPVSLLSVSSSWRVFEGWQDGNGYSSFKVL